ncbi:MAG: hypothetical protein IAF38_00325 [Bacteroidia bacterium]|nr:hypothetical protein [Bacteroidia bacterium]
MLILILPFLIVILVNSFSPQATFSYKKENCTRYCHNNGCPHFEKKMADVKPGSLKSKAFDFYCWNIEALKNNPLDLSYAEMNILVYVLFFPLSSVFLFRFLVRKKKHNQKKQAPTLRSSILPPNCVLLFIGPLYWYFVDFCVNAGNGMGLTYIEFNFILFCLLFPLITIILIFLNIYRYLLSPLLKRKK